jgi:hypothetical protein
MVGSSHALEAAPLGDLSGATGAPSASPTHDHALLCRRQRISLKKNRMQ